MAAYWYIASSKRRMWGGKEDIIPIDLEKWRDVVDHDNEVVWFETTTLGKEEGCYSLNSQGYIDKTHHTQARMDINSEGNGTVQLNYIMADERYPNLEFGYISIMHTRETLTRIEKYYEIAQKLGARLFKNRTEINAKQMEKIRQKYVQKKSGIRAPEDE